MANYVKATNFLVKDSLVSGDPAKLIKGTEIDTEFNAIATSVSSKADTNSTVLTGIPLAPTASTGNSTTQIATTAFVQAAATALASYPVGSIYISTVATNPNTLFGFGTWVAFGAGRVVLGSGGSYGAGTTGGSADAIIPSHIHGATSTVNDPTHNHGSNSNQFAGTSVGSSVGYSSFSNGASPTTANASTGITVSTAITTTGVSPTNANLPPYIVVYMWNRTA